MVRIVQRRVLARSSPGKWRLGSIERNVLALGTKFGDALLVEFADRYTWRQFHLSGGATPQSSNDRVLQTNNRLFGPAKLIASPSNFPICRLDVPHDLTDTMGELCVYDVDACSLNAHSAWVRTVTALATGTIRKATSGAAVDSVVAAEAKLAGWSVSADDDQTIIHLQLPGIYRQLLLEHDEWTGVKLSVDLIELTGVSDECQLAMLLFAQEANARLPLVRFAITEPSASHLLRAEVSFGTALASGSLLLHALQALEAAVGLTARELEALRNVELARLLLSAAAVRNSVSPK